MSRHQRQGRKPPQGNSNPVRVPPPPVRVDSQIPPVADPPRLSNPEHEANTWRSALQLINYVLAAFSDVFFLILFTAAAIISDVHFHEVLLHLFFAAATFAVVRIGEYQDKKNELRDLCEQLKGLQDSTLSMEFTRLERKYQDWHALFRTCYGVAFAIWFIVALCVARAMKDCTNAIIKHATSDQAHGPTDHPFTSPEYWHLPEANLLTLWIAGSGATFAFVGALALTIACRRSEFRTDARKLVRLFVDKLNFHGEGKWESS